MFTSQKPHPVEINIPRIVVHRYYSPLPGYLHVSFNNTASFNASLVISTHMDQEIEKFTLLSYSYHNYDNPLNTTQFNLTNTGSSIELSFSCDNCFRAVSLNVEALDELIVDSLKTLSPLTKNFALYDGKAMSHAEALTKDFYEILNKIPAAMRLTGTNNELKVDYTEIRRIFRSILNRLSGEIDKLKQLAPSNISDESVGPDASERALPRPGFR